uniref:Acetyl CoA Carboxylase-2 n=1 Tax=Plutella xylostella TaxID=51655 RepID=A0A1L8D6K8_PLUXY
MAVQSEKPDIMLGVVCGSILIADNIITSNFHEFKSALEKPTKIFYILCQVQATKSGPTSYFVSMNGSFKELEAHKLTDGGTLLSVDGASYTTYLKDEVDKYRIVIGNQTVVFDKEKDPSKLRAPSAGKLVNLLLDDKGHVDKGQPYAEIEVMKMVMTLSAPEAGIVTWTLRPGAVLDPGSLIGTLELDDPSLVTTAQLYKGQFPIEDNQMLSDKLNYQHTKFKQILESTLGGYCLPDPYNAPRLREIVEKFMQSLRDPSLPLLELQEVLSSASGRIPISVEKKVRKLMALYERNITSVLAQFPSQQIASVIDHHAASLPKRADRDQFFMSTQALVVLVQRYRNGIRGRMKAAVHDLLKQYYQVESNFQMGSYDKCVQALRDKYKDNMQDVVNIIFSHNQVAKKNVLVTLLIDHLWSNEPGLTDELAHTLNELTSLHRAEQSRVALRARQASKVDSTFIGRRPEPSSGDVMVLIAAHQPAYELRHNQMESIFLSAVDMYGHDFHPENLQKLILSETIVLFILSGLYSLSIFDILHDFFYHTNAARARGCVCFCLSLSRGVHFLSAVDMYGHDFHPANLQKLILSETSIFDILHDFFYHTNAASPGLCVCICLSLSRGVHFLSAVDMYGHDFHPENLQKLILSETSIFDILHDFFYHTNAAVCNAALEVYVRRAYTSYDITTLQHLALSGELGIVHFQFILPTGHPNRIPINQSEIELASAEDQEGVPAELSTAAMRKCHHRTGVLAAFESFEQFAQYADELLDLVHDFASSATVRKEDLQALQDGSENRDSTSLSMGDFKPSTEADDVPLEPIHIVMVGVGSTSDGNDSALARRFGAFCRAHRAELHRRRIRRITFMSLVKRQFPKFFTFRARNDFTEDTIYRHLEPASAFQLELFRMRTYDLEALPTSNQKMHLYLGKAKAKKGQEVKDYRFFIRSIIRHQDLITKEASFEYLQNEGERVLLEALDELEVATFSRKTDCNHIFLNFGPTVIMDPAKIAESVVSIVLRYGARLFKLRVLQAEIRFTIRIGPGAPTKNIRLCLANDSSYSLDVYTYEEIMFQAYGPKKGPMHGLPISTPYVTKDYLQHKRSLATSQGTTYVYDMPDMFRQMVERRWRECIEQGTVDGPAPENVLSSVELVAETDGERRMFEVTRLPGQNTVGMVAWRITMYTPECPDGRDIVLIANDLTHYMGSFGPQEDWLYYRASQYARERKIPRTSITNQRHRDIVLIANELTHYMGSFGPQEDWLYYRASQYARERKIPRIYISVNSGARIGVAEEVKSEFQVAWLDPARPERGFKYIYLSPEAYSQLSPMGSVKAELIEDEGEARYKITDIIGKEDGLGVECLRDAGLIAGETAQAYEDIVTISIVTCRAIGSYDKCVQALRDKYKDNMQDVVNIIFSHNQVAKKNVLVTLLIDHLWSNEPGLTDELAHTLNELTSLHRAEQSRVALRARQVLIAAHQPAYELRHNQMESIFLSAVDMYGHDFHPENLQKLILSETSIFDILHDFFYHTNAALRAFLCKIPDFLLFPNVSIAPLYSPGLCVCICLSLSRGALFLSAVDMYGHDFHPENLQKLILSETSICDILHDFFYHTNAASPGLCVCICLSLSRGVHFLSAVDMYGHDFHPENLQKLILSETSIFDILHDFFYHTNAAVCNAALEVYVRRAYTSYDITTLQHLALSGELGIVHFQFILPTGHPNRIQVCNAALEVYVRRAYTSYDITTLQHLALSGELGIVHFQFILPTGHPNSLLCPGRLPIYTTYIYLSGELGIVHFQFILPTGHPNRIPINQSEIELASAEDQEGVPAELSTAAMRKCHHRTGVLAAFESFEQFAQYADELLDLVHDFASSATVRKEDLQALQDGSENRDSTSLSMGDFKPSTEADDVPLEPIHIVMVGVGSTSDGNDSALARRFGAFCRAHRAELHRRRIRRITFMSLVKRQFPKFFTFRARNDFTEDTIYRHLEPASAFQLELFRMRTYDLEALPTSNQKMHLYLGKAKAKKGQEVKDYRFFIRSIIRHQDLITKEASFEYLQNEGERVLLEALDELEVATFSRKTDCNHIFLNFGPTVIMDPAKIAESVVSIVLRYGARLFKLRVLQAEIRFTIRIGPGAPTKNIRLCLANDSSYSLDVYTYEEVTDSRTGVIMFQAYGPKKGPMHGLPISTPYVTKDYLQHKRSLATSQGTTYVYDMPDMFRQMVERRWRECIEQGTVDGPAPENVLSSVELVAETDGERRMFEVTRLPGQNTVGMVAWRITMYTPECPDGRDIVLIANDLTHYMGSFGPQEDWLYYRASQYARERKIPRINVTISRFVINTALWLVDRSIHEFIDVNNGSVPT